MFAGEDIIVAADVNARSVLWFSDSTDELESFILANDMVIFNSMSELSTFENTRGQSGYIDVTIGSRSLDGRILDWRVSDETISSDRLIMFSLKITEGQNCWRRSA